LFLLVNLLFFFSLLFFSPFGIQFVDSLSYYISEDLPKFLKNIFLIPIIYLSMIICGIIHSFLFFSYSYKKEIFHYLRIFFQNLKKKFSNTYQQIWNYLTQKKNELNNLTSSQIERGIKISQNIKYISSFLAILTAILAFKYSDDEVYLKTSGSVSVISGTAAFVSEIVKEKFLEPQMKRLEESFSNQEIQGLRQLLGNVDITNSSSILPTV
jgi:hypothetical protein